MEGGTIVTEGVALADRSGLADDALVTAVRRGDDRSFEELYWRYGRRINAYVQGMVKDHGRAEDVTQEVFVSALRRMRATDRPIAFRPWIYEIARNACIDAHRRTKRTEEVPLEPEGLSRADGGRLVDASPAPENAVAVKEQLDTLRGAFGGLSDTHHEILIMRELEGRSYADIGEARGVARPPAAAHPRRPQAGWLAAAPGLPPQGRRAGRRRQGGLGRAPAGLRRAAAVLVGQGG